MTEARCVGSCHKVLFNAWLSLLPPSTADWHEAERPHQQASVPHWNSMGKLCILWTARSLQECLIANRPRGFRRKAWARSAVSPQNPNSCWDSHKEACGCDVKPHGVVPNRSRAAAPCGTVSPVFCLMARSHLMSRCCRLHKSLLHRHQQCVTSNPRVKFLGYGVSGVSSRIRPRLCVLDSGVEGVRCLRPKQFQTLRAAACRVVGTW